MSAPQNADVAVVGLGRVGLPLALSFADRGLSTIGSGETLQGAARFSGGEGRHGAFKKS